MTKLHDPHRMGKICTHGRFLRGVAGAPQGPVASVHHLGGAREQRAAACRQSHPRLRHSSPRTVATRRPTALRALRHSHECEIQRRISPLRVHASQHHLRRAAVHLRRWALPRSCSSRSPSRPLFEEHTTFSQTIGLNTGVGRRNSPARPTMGTVASLGNFLAFTDAL